MARKLVCPVEHIPINGMKTFSLAPSKKVLILNSNDKTHACQGMCPHQDVCLEEGLFDGEILTCHQHLWQWKISTGEPVGLAEAPLEIYDITIEGGNVYIDD